MDMELGYNEVLLYAHPLWKACQKKRTFPFGKCDPNLQNNSRWIGLGKGEGAPVFWVDIILVKKFMLLDRFLGREKVHVYTILGVQNMQNWGKECVFGHVNRWFEHDGQIKERTWKHM